MTIFGVLMLVVGVVLAVVGVSMNNSVEAQLTSMLNNGSANPGDIWLYIGIAVAVVGLVLLIAGIMKKKK